MNLKKKMLAVAAVSALTAATAVPAMAFENEFHGMYRFKGVISNMSSLLEAPTQTAAIKDNPRTRTFLEQRARLLYSAKASDDLKLVTHFELDYSKFGDGSYGAARNTGAAIGADEINIETKNIYLDFNIPTANKINFKVGMQPWVDSYGGLVVNADMAGVLASAKYGNLANSVGFFRFDDKGSIAGKDTRDFFVVDSKFNVTKDVRVGGSYYLLNDDSGYTGITDQTATAASSIQDPTRVSKKSIIHTLGLNGEAKVGPATISAGAVYQFGNLENEFSYAAQAKGSATNALTNTGSGHLSAFGGYVGGKVAAGPGTFNIVAAYTTGDSSPTSGNSNAFQSIHNNTSSSYSENTFYGANMHLLLRSKYEINSGSYIIGSSNNQNQGMTIGALGYDMKFTDKLYGNANVGFGAVSKDPGAHKSKYLGTELNAEVGYKLADNLNVSLLGAFLKLGDYYEGVGVAADKKPNDPFYTTLMINYVF